MTTHHPDLRSLDAAAPALTPDQEERARASLERIVASPPVRASRRAARTPWRRLALVGAVAATLAVVLVVAQRSGGDGDAYASWTPTPSAVTADDRAAAAAACREKLRGFSIDVDRAYVALAERRGDHVVVLFRTDDPDISAPCLVRNPPGSGDTSVVNVAAGGGSGPAQTAPARGFTEGAIAQFASPQASVTDGAVGTGVTGVTIHAGTLTVEASVRDGRYAAWWPGPAFRDAPAPPSGEGGPEPILTYDLTLRDGTVVRDAQPARPR